MANRIRQFTFRGPRNLDLTGIEGLGDAIGGIGKGLQKQKAQDSFRNDLARVAEIARKGGSAEEINTALAGAKNNRLRFLGIQGLARMRQLNADREFQLRQRNTAGANGGRANPARSNPAPVGGPGDPANERFRQPANETIFDNPGLASLNDEFELPNRRGPNFRLASLQADPRTAELVESAIDAINRGADPLAVRQRLLERGINPIGVV